MATRAKKTRTRETGEKGNDSDIRRQRIAEAAYYKAEKRGFAPGLENEDWLEAEKEIEPESGDS